MQRNPSKTPADPVLSSRFICVKPPSPCTHVANLLSEGFFIYLETAEQILRQCTLSQLRWLLARGCVPAEGTCSWLAGACGCGVNGGVCLGGCSKLTKPFPSQPSARPGEPRCAASPGSPGGDIVFCREEDILKSSPSPRFAAPREGDSRRSRTRGRPRCCWGFCPRWPGAQRAAEGKLFPSQKVIEQG